jgi:Tfp pilus assembly protein FimV
MESKFAAYRRRQREEVAALSARVKQLEQELEQARNTVQYKNEYIVSLLSARTGKVKKPRRNLKEIEKIRRKRMLNPRW